MHILTVILIGSLAGVLARFLLPRHEMGDLLFTMVLGSCAALVVDLIARNFGRYQPGETVGFVAVAIAAALMLAGYLGLAWWYRQPGVQKLRR